MARQPDPRATRRYREGRARFIAEHPPGVACVLCGRPIDTTLPGNVPAGPTVEHRIPVRRLRHLAADRAELIEMVCDQTTWAIAHRRCQDSQGGSAAADERRKRARPPERDW